LIAASSCLAFIDDPVVDAYRSRLCFLPLLFGRPPSLPFARDAAACVRRSLSLARGTAADHFDLVGVLDALEGIIEQFN